MTTFLHFCFLQFEVPLFYVGCDSFLFAYFHWVLLKSCDGKEPNTWSRWSLLLAKSVVIQFHCDYYSNYLPFVAHTFILEFFSLLDNKSGILIQDHKKKIYFFSSLSFGLIGHPLNLSWYVDCWGLTYMTSFNLMDHVFGGLIKYAQERMQYIIYDFWDHKYLKYTFHYFWDQVVTH